MRYEGLKRLEDDVSVSMLAIYMVRTALFL
jgi:hypothetical protein